MADTLTDLLALAERVEQATGADVEIDAAILAIIEADMIAIGISPQIHRYTASADAAVRLAPEGYGYQLSKMSADKSTCFVGPFQHVPGAWVYKEAGVGNAATPALALTAASLRARAASADTHPQDGDALAAPLVSGAARSEAKGDAQP